MTARCEDQTPRVRDPGICPSHKRGFTMLSARRCRCRVASSLITSAGGPPWLLAGRLHWLSSAPLPPLQGSIFSHPFAFSRAISDSGRCKAISSAVAQRQLCPYLCCDNLRSLDARVAALARKTRASRIISQLVITEAHLCSRQLSFPSMIDVSPESRVGRCAYVCNSLTTRCLSLGLGLTERAIRLLLRLQGIFSVMGM